MQVSNAPEIVKIISAHRLFSGIGEQILLSLIAEDGVGIQKFDRGEPVPGELRGTRKLAFLLTGSVGVYSADDSRSMTLRILSPGDAFGVASLFSDGEPPSHIMAQKKSELLFIDAHVYGKFLEENRDAMYNYISFLSDRICYLNRKILCLTAGSAERRLAFFLADVSEHDTFSLPVPMSSLSEMLGVGRASLYRAEAQLTADGYLTREGKTITIINRADMLAHYS